MKFKELEVEFFILEDDPSFINLSEKQQCLRVVERSSRDLKRWYFELGCSKLIPATYEEFKQKIIDWCQGKDWTDVIKYKEEPLSFYCLRLYEKAKNIDKTEVFMRLSKENLPQI